MLSSLCFPDSAKSCFGCCPPIRPAGYDHFEYKNIIKRQLLDNSLNYNRGERSIRPITGFSCWALGYIDDVCKQPGCLLHPFQNKGEDLRYRIDYGTKCIREACFEAMVFEKLTEKHKTYWLSLAHDMDSFEYSSRNKNILFKLLGWGDKILSIIADHESEPWQNKSDFFKSYPFFDSTVSQKGSAYLLLFIISRRGSDILKHEKFEEKFIKLSRKITTGIKERFDIGAGAIHVYRMDFESMFTDFLRLSAGIRKNEYSTVEKIKQYTDEQLELFIRG